MHPSQIASHQLPPISEIGGKTPCAVARMVYHVFRRDAQATRARRPAMAITTTASSWRVISADDIMAQANMSTAEWDRAIDLLLTHLPADHAVALIGIVLALTVGESITADEADLLVSAIASIA